MQRVAIVGCIGSGKSTLARALGEALDIDVFHLDGLWWQPGRYRITGRTTVATRTMEPRQFRRLEEDITTGAAWIIDGDAANKDLRLSRADTVIFLDLPRWLCTWRVTKRHFRGSAEYPDGVRGSIRWTLLLVRWIWGPPGLQGGARHWFVRSPSTPPVQRPSTFPVAARCARSFVPSVRRSRVPDGTALRAGHDCRSCRAGGSDARPSGRA